MTLLHQACIERLIDVSTARPLDRVWWQRVIATLDYLEDKNRVMVARMEHDLHCGAITYLAGDKPFSIHWDQALTLQSNVRRRLFPWDKDVDPRDSYRKMSDAWEAEYGSLSDPETVRKVNEAAKALRNRGAARRRKERGGR